MASSDPKIDLIQSPTRITDTIYTNAGPTAWAGHFKAGIALVVTTADKPDFAAPHLWLTLSRDEARRLARLLTPDAPKPEPVASYAFRDGAICGPTGAVLFRVRTDHDARSAVDVLNELASWPNTEELTARMEQPAAQEKVQARLNSIGGTVVTWNSEAGFERGFARGYEAGRRCR